MKSFSQWRLGEASDPKWESLKTASFPVDDSIKSFVRPKIEKIAEELVNRLKGQKISSFRDLPPDMRDQYAQAMVACVMEVFYPVNSVPTEIPVPKSKPASPPTVMPQDEVLPPVGAKG